MDNVTNETAPIGDFKHIGVQMSPERANEFLAKLETIMREYKIEKADVCWSRFKNPPIDEEADNGS